MKLSWQWLKEWLPQIPAAETISEQLTALGLEVNTSETITAHFHNVVIAEVKSISPHPNADKLKVCQVDDGKEIYQVVCGAPNVAAYRKVILARPNAQLGSLSIKETVIRGINSSGMLCSLDELQLTDLPQQGILLLEDSAPLGQPLAEYLQLPDIVFDIDLTPNRGDCMSVRGIVREIAVKNQLSITAKNAFDYPISIDQQLTVQVDANTACPAYSYAIIKDLNSQAITPMWMQHRLQLANIRSINLVTDVTNYVMLELGQPLHGYDLTRLNAPIVVRFAHVGEQIQLLDQQIIQLRSDTLVIADQDKVIGLAGVMGGDYPSIQTDTTDILLEATFLKPQIIAGQARSYKLATEASQRFERGVDPLLQQQALKRACQLLVKYGEGKASAIQSIVNEAELPNAAVITLTAQQINRVLGMTIKHHFIEQTLTQLGFIVTAIDQHSWRCQAPSWRFDIDQSVDLIEEIARVQGYQQLPICYPQARLQPQLTTQQISSKQRIQTYFGSRGYQEAITYSFISEELQQLICPGIIVPQLANPISIEMAVMRSSLWPGLLKTAQYNLNRQQKRLKFFEIGSVFQNEVGDNLQQLIKIGGVAAGSYLPHDWINKNKMLSFFDIKGDLEALLNSQQPMTNWHFKAAEHPALHPGQSAEIFDDKQRSIGWIGILHPRLQHYFDFKIDLVLFELDWLMLVEPINRIYKSISRFPAITRDIAIIVANDLTIDTIITRIRQVATKSLRSVELFDVYQGDNIMENHVSIALSLTWQSDNHTLQDSEIDADLTNILTILQNNYSVKLRNIAKY